MANSYWRCDCGEMGLREVKHKIGETPETPVCPCGRLALRVYSVPLVLYRGEGFTNAQSKERKDAGKLDSRNSNAGGT